MDPARRRYLDSLDRVTEALKILAGLAGEVLKLIAAARGLR